MSANPVNVAAPAVDDTTVNIFELMDRARSRPNLISMGLGDPDLATPAHIIAAAKQAIAQGRTGPAPVMGLSELRQAIAQKLARDNGVTIDPETEVLVTTGGQEALFLVIQALIEPGDEVIMPDPRYTSYDEAIALAGGNIVLVPTTEKDAFDLDPDEVEKRLTPASKVLLLVSPSNPTAGIVTPPNIRRLAEIAQERNLIVISDEIYEKFIFDDHQHLSIGSLPGMRERTITLNGASKTYAMTGWRIGYGVMRADLATHVARLMTNSNSCTASFTQVAGIEALRGPQESVEGMCAEFKKRRDVMVAGLNKIKGFSCRLPHGAFYVFPNITGTGWPSKKLADALLDEAGVAALSGTAFGNFGEGYLRFSVANSIENIEKALDRVGEWVTKTL
jgi:aspartate aminotransferase